MPAAAFARLRLAFLACVRPARGRDAPLVLSLSLSLGGCTYGGSGPPAPHYDQFSAIAPRGDTVTVCSAHGCRHKSPFTFTRQDMATLAALMAVETGTPAGERRAIAKAIGWIERRVGPVTGTAADRAGLDFAGSGDPTQMDCVDEATNTTSYLLVLAAHGLLRHHEVLSPMAKDVPFLRWTHYFAVIREKGSGQRWAVDSFMYANGREPIIMEAEKWYVKT
jgi:hypothetical protein